MAVVLPGGLLTTPYLDYSRTKNLIATYGLILVGERTLLEPER
jgi:hypothetical protein